MKRRVAAAGLLVLAVVAGSCVHLLVPDSVASDIAGDVLYALAAYTAVVILAPRWVSPAVGAVALAWCLAVELFQLTGVPLLAGAAFSPAMLVLGTVFDPRDLVVYTGTVTAAVAIDMLVRSARRAAHPQITD